MLQFNVKSAMYSPYTVNNQKFHWWSDLHDYVNDTWVHIKLFFQCYAKSFANMATPVCVCVCLMTAYMAINCLCKHCNWTDQPTRWENHTHNLCTGAITLSLQHNICMTYIYTNVHFHINIQRKRQFPSQASQECIQDIFLSHYP